MTILASEIVGLIRRRRFADALAMMLDEWSETRDADLGQLIGRLSKQVPREPIVARTRALRLRRWLELAEDGDDADVGRLLDCLQTFARKQLEVCFADMEEWRLDPRLADYSFALANKPPDGVLGHASLPLWDRILSVAATNADSRHLKLIETLGQDAHSHRWYAVVSHIAASRESVAQRAQAAARGVRQLASNVCAAIEPAVAAIEPTSASAIDIETLFAEVYRDPDSDDPRAVLADVLTDAGDPRGELIVLQLIDRADMTAEQRRRERDLIAGYGRRWLGPLEPFARKTGLAFERGFVSAMRITSYQMEIESAVGLPEWNTLIDVDLHQCRAGQLALVGPLSGLRSIRGASSELVRDGRFPRLETLGVVNAHDTVLSALDGSAYPALRELIIDRSASDFVNLEAVVSSERLFPELAQLEIIDYPHWGRPSTNTWLPELRARKLRPIDLVFSRFDEAGWRIEVNLDEAGKHSRLRMHNRLCYANWDRFLQHWPSALTTDLGWITELVVEPTWPVKERNDDHRLRELLIAGGLASSALTIASTIR